MKNKKIILFILFLTLLFVSCNRKKELDVNVSSNISTYTASIISEQVLDSSQPQSSSAIVSSKAETTTNKNNASNQSTPKPVEPDNLSSMSILPKYINTGYLSYDGTYLYYNKDNNLVKYNLATNSEEVICFRVDKFKIYNNMLLTFKYDGSETWYLYDLNNQSSNKNISNQVACVTEDFFLYNRYFFVLQGKRSIYDNSYSSPFLNYYDTQPDEQSTSSGSNSDKKLCDDYLYNLFVCGKYLYGSAQPPVGPPSQNDADGEGIRINMETLDVKRYGKDIQFVKPSSFIASERYVVYKKMSENKYYILDSDTDKSIDLNLNFSYIIINDILIKREVMGFNSSDFDLYSITSSQTQRIKGVPGFVPYEPSKKATLPEEKVVPNLTYFNKGMSYCKFPEGTGFAGYYPSEITSLNPVKQFKTSTNFQAVFAIGDWVYGQSITINQKTVLRYSMSDPSQVTKFN